MIQMLALKISKHTYPIAAGFLNAGFLAVPEADTYGCVVVINQIQAPEAKPISGARPRVMYSGTGSRRRNFDERTITFENSWYDEETFNAEFTIDTTSDGSPGFWEITRKPEAEIKKYYSEIYPEDQQTRCQCEGQCEYCHGR
jgi:hypothetical protein